MDIPESDHAELNNTLLEVGSFYRTTPNFRPDIVKKARAIVDECCNLPEWNATENYMGAGMAAVIIYLKKTYPWMIEKAIYAVQHECMMYMK